MKLDKRACRKVAAKPLSLPAGHGLLVAEQIDHLIKAEIHNLGHTKSSARSSSGRTPRPSRQHLPSW